MALGTSLGVTAGLLQAIPDPFWPDQIQPKTLQQWQARLLVPLPAMRGLVCTLQGGVART